LNDRTLRASSISHLPSPVNHSFSSRANETSQRKGILFFVLSLYLSALYLTVSIARERERQRERRGKSRERRSLPTGKRETAYSNTSGVGENI